MRLLFKQRLFSWFDSYDIYNENGDVVYSVQGKLAWGHRLVIYDAFGKELGEIQEKVFSLMPKFYLIENGQEIGMISQEFTFFKPRFNIDFNGWHIEGDFWEWNYTIQAGNRDVMSLSKEIFHWTDTYVMDIVHDEDALYCLMVVLAIDAAKCSRGNNS